MKIEWLTYAQAAEYIGYSMDYMRHMVSARTIPFYGLPRSRRFRRDMLDLWVTDRDVAMRKWHEERRRAAA